MLGWLLVGVLAGAVWWFYWRDSSPGRVVADPRPGPEHRAQPSSVQVRASVTPRPTPQDFEHFVVLDLETTGLNPNRNKIIEIAAIRVSLADMNSRDAKVDAVEALIKITGKVPPKIVELTGITDDMIKAAGQPLEQVLSEVAQLASGCPVVAYNASFDRRFLEVAMAAHGIDFEPEWICALQMARAAWPDSPNHKLAYLTRSMEDVSAHRAAGDCMRALVVYAAAVKELGQYRP